LFTKVISPSKLEQQLNTIDPNELTPKQALDALYQLKKILNKDN
jgi:DNA mismatch repair ATPase MutS